MKYFQYILIIIVFAACANTKQDNKNQKEEIQTVQVKLSKLDSVKLADFWQTAKENKLEERNIPEIQTAVAEWFMGTPYVAGTLDINSEEKLVVNLQVFDCVTFAETVTALGICVKSGELTNRAYFKNLQKIRYRNGEINGYTSRLHYFTDWLLDNQRKGIIKIVSNDFGDKDFDAFVNFMSQHPQYYKALSDSIVKAEIQETEKRVSRANLKMVSVENLENVENLINDGDIIAVSSEIKGIDIAHTGIAKHYNGRLHFIHASSSKGKVVLSEKPLSEYLKGIKNDNGVLTGRINLE